MEKLAALLFTILCLKNPLFPLSNRCLKPIDLFSRLFPQLPISQFYQPIKPLLPYQDYLLGLNNSSTVYFLILQNDYELRTNGGFPGSYAVITFTNSQPSFRFEDIYTPDGQIKGYIKPPPPIQTAFQLGEYRLRDSDWSPDFPKTAATFRWFFQKGGEVNPNLIVTLNFSTLKKIVALLGPINVPEYQLTLDTDNLYLFLQNQSEVGFFPGSTQKKDAIAAAAKALINRFVSLSPSQKISLVSLIIDQLNHQNILVNSDNSPLQALLSTKNWAGELKPSVCSSADCVSDTYALIENNLGANKANYYVTRQTQHEIISKNNWLIHSVKVIFENSSPSESSQPPLFYGGNYLSYLRFYIPNTAQGLSVTTKPPLSILPNGLANKLDVANVYGLKEVGFFHLTTASSSSEVSLEYRLPLQPKNLYQLSLLKQSGLDHSPQNINLFGETISSTLENDFSTSVISPN